MRTNNKKKGGIMRSIVLKSAVLFVGLVFLTYSSAYAYIDPGTGSFVVQAVIASVAGAIYVIKTYWAKIISVFKKKTDNE
jgi:hypothetical protein